MEEDEEEDEDESEEPSSMEEDPAVSEIAEEGSEVKL